MAEVTSELKNKLAALIKHEHMLEATADQVPSRSRAHTLTSTLTCPHLHPPACSHTLLSLLAP